MLNDEPRLVLSTGRGFCFVEQRDSSNGAFGALQGVARRKLRGAMTPTED